MIAFYADEDVKMPALRKTILKQWLQSLARSYNKEVGELCYQLCDDERILEVNRQFLDHDYYTDIITFDECIGNLLHGDMLISLDTVRSNAEGLGVSFEEELHRVFAHGLLHLIGLGDKSPEEAQAMRRAEEQALQLLRELLPPGASLFKK